MQKLTRRIFPAFWQKPRISALCGILTEGSFDVVNKEYVRFLGYARNIVGYSIQRLSLERSLQAQFSPTIRVEPNNTIDRIFVFNSNEEVLEEEKIYTYNGSTAPQGQEVFVFGTTEVLVITSNVGYTVVVETWILFFFKPNIEAWIDRVNVAGVKYEFTELVG